MKCYVAVFLLMTLLGCVHRPEMSELSIRQIEQLSFEDAYRLWRQEQDSITGRLSSDGSYSYSIITTGASDPQTGEFSPSEMAALECRLGREAHLRKRFLREQLTTDADVHQILEASPRLCEEYGITSMAQVVVLADGRYSRRTTDGWSPQVRQRLWLEALNGTSSQPDGAANGSQPIRSGRNRTSPAAGSRR